MTEQLTGFERMLFIIFAAVCFFIAQLLEQRRSL